MNTHVDHYIGATEYRHGSSRFVSVFQVNFAEVLHRYSREASDRAWGVKGRKMASKSPRPMRFKVEDTAAGGV